MDALTIGVPLSLVALTTILGALSVRGLVRFVRQRALAQLMWGGGLGFAALATGVELVVYLGVVNGLLLQVYVFLSAAIVGVLSLGSTHVIRSERFRTGYSGYILAACSLVGGLTFTTPLSSTMVVQGVISGNPPVDLIVVSCLVTIPATFVLLGAVVVALRRSFRWRTLMMGIGACVLAGGGALYIASFPVALYYSEFIGIIFIFVGLVSLPHIASAASPVGRPIGKGV
ncbi:MAG TPA: hypothetical protein VEH28_05725 [Thermoplasmata archaeon]|nr:hypothetical protein [Thermoplasmata archaeon]